MDDLWSRLEAMLSEKVSPEYANTAANRLRETQASNPKGTLSDFGFGPQHGLNVVSSPDMYFPPKFKENTKVDTGLGYSTGGEYSPLGGVRLNPRSHFDPTASATHEAQHWKDWSMPSRDRTSFEAVGKTRAGENTKADLQTLSDIKRKLEEYRSNTPTMRGRRILSGQEDNEEILPQLRSYESMLPAGMSIFQSPLGKSVFKTPEERLYYLNKTQPSMTDQTYLEELRQRAEKAKR